MEEFNDDIWAEVDVVEAQHSKKRRLPQVLNDQQLKEDDAQFAGHNVAACNNNWVAVLYKATVNIDDKGGLLLKFSGYHREIMKFMKTVEGCREHPLKQMQYVLDKPTQVLEVLKNSDGFIPGVKLKVEELDQVPQAILQSIVDLHNDESRYDDMLDDEFRNKLRPFQVEGVKFALRHGGRALIADEMGLGKTIQSLAIAKCYKDLWPFLVIVPSSLRDVWLDSGTTWLGIPSSQMLAVYNVKKDKDKINQPNLQMVVVCYDSMNQIKDILIKSKFQVIIADESHYIKSFRSQRSKATIPVMHSAKHVILLSGTAMVNRPIEMFPQLKALLPKSTNLVMQQFAERYCSGDYFDPYKGAKNLNELNAVVSQIMIRRLKKDVANQLPQKTRQKVYLPMDSKQQKEISELKQNIEKQQAELQEAMEEGSSGSHDKDRLITIMRVQTARIKRPSVEKYVKELLERGEKFLIYGHHQDMLDGIERIARSAQVDHIRIDGNTNPQSRNSLVEKFQNSQNVKMAILSIKTASVGYTLTAASLVVFAELSWVPGDIRQAEDRAHRIGQQSNVTVQFLMLQGSVDEIIWQTIQRKLGDVGTVLDGKRDALVTDGTVMKQLVLPGQSSMDQFVAKRKLPFEKNSPQNSGAKRQKSITDFINLT